MNRRTLLSAAALLALSACTASQVTHTLATAQQVVSDGQLVCQVGPTAVAMLDPSGAAILAKGATKSAVDTVCGLVNGVATALPAASVQPAGLVVKLPPSVTIPLKAGVSKVADYTELMWSASKPWRQATGSTLEPPHLAFVANGAVCPDGRQPQVSEAGPVNSFSVCAVQ